MIYDRLKVNPNNDFTYLPRNTEGKDGNSSSKFWSPEKGTKTFLIVALFIALMIWTVLGLDGIISWIFRLIFIVAFIGATRVFIIEEPYYRRVFARTEKLNKSTSGVNYGIMYYNEREGGCSVGFLDGTIGVFVSFERESKVGRSYDYDELCKDTFSNFLLELHENKYNIIKCITMDTASRDARYITLREQIRQTSNPAVRNILQLNYSYMMGKSEHAFYEQDTYLIYTNNSLRLNTIIDDVLKITSPLMQTMFSSRKILKEAEINDLHMQVNAVEYFDSLTAKNEMFENLKSKRKVNLYSFTLKNGNEFVLTPEQLKKLGKIYNEYLHDKSIKLNLIDELMKADTSMSITKTSSKDVSNLIEDVEEFVPLKIETVDDDDDKNKEEIKESKDNKNDLNDLDNAIKDLEKESKEEQEDEFEFDM